MLETLLITFREGMETAMMLGSLANAINIGEMLTGARLGFGSVAIIGYLWISRIDPRQALSHVLIISIGILY